MQRGKANGRGDCARPGRARSAAIDHQPATKNDLFDDGGTGHGMQCHQPGHARLFPGQAKRLLGQGFDCQQDEGPGDRDCDSKKRCGRGAGQAVGIRATRLRGLTVVAPKFSQIDSSRGQRKEEQRMVHAVRFQY